MNDICEVCDKARAAHTHHRKLRSQGGGDEPANLMRVCLDCHNWIHANPSESYARGLLVHSWADPAAVKKFVEVEEFVIDDSNREAVHQALADGQAYFLEPQPGETCEKCKRRVPHAKKASTPKSRVWSTRLPIDDEGADTFSELVDAAAEHHGLTSRPYHRYLVLLFGVTMLLQAKKGELPA